MIKEETLAKQTWAWRADRTRLPCCGVPPRSTLPAHASPRPLFFGHRTELVRPPNNKIP